MTRVTHITLEAIHSYKNDNTKVNVILMGEDKLSESQMRYDIVLQVINLRVQLLEVEYGTMVLKEGARGLSYMDYEVDNKKKLEVGSYGFDKEDLAHIIGEVGKEVIQTAVDAVLSRITISGGLAELLED